MNSFPFIKDKKFKVRDASSSKIPQYKEIPGYATNENGEVINMSRYPKYKRVEDLDVQPKIQSYYEEVDLYHILSKVAINGDTSLLATNKTGVYTDISDVPDNFHDLTKIKEKASSQFFNLTDEEKAAVLKFFGIDSDNKKEEIKTESKVEEGGENNA